jgi:hypothetical protein
MDLGVLVALILPVYVFIKCHHINLTVKLTTINSLSRDQNNIIQAIGVPTSYWPLF